MEPQEDDVDTETFYAIRRADGGLIYGEYGWMGTDGPTDWTAVEDGDESAEYEMLRMTAEVAGRRTFPVCAERCDKPAEFWGLCEEHAREDDEETLNEGLAARARQADIGANLPTGFVDTLGDT